MESQIDWGRVILFILECIVQGMSKDTAVREAAARFGISEDEIWSHGGF